MKKSFLSVFTMVLLTCMILVGCKSEAKKADKTADKVTTETATKKPDDAAKKANATDPDPDTPKTSFEFDKMEHDFGDIDEGDKVNTVFSFKNTGNEPLIISSAKGSCGCTVPKWPKEPIPPGASGEIQVEFNSKNKPGKQTKTVTIHANTDPNPTRLTIKAQVAKDPNKPEKTAATGAPQIKTAN